MVRNQIVCWCGDKNKDGVHEMTNSELWQMINSSFSSLCFSLLLVSSAVGDFNITVVLTTPQKTIRNYTCLSFSMIEKHKYETKLTLRDSREKEREPPHWSGNRQKMCVSECVQASLRLSCRAVSFSGSLQDDAECQRRNQLHIHSRPAGAPDWAVPVCSCLTYRTRNPTTPTPPPYLS